MVDRRWVAACLVLPVVTAAATGDTVIRRGAEPPIVGDVRGSGIDDAGVQVSLPSGAVRLVAWDHIREIRLDPADDAGSRRRAIERRMPTAEALWRARIRLQRNDPALAEPLFQRLFEQYRGQTHQTALLVAEGLLRCRLARGANVLAVIPALETARLQRAGVNETGGGVFGEALEPVLDEETSLCPQLPPVWVHSRLLTSLERDLAVYDAQGDEVVAAMASAYLRAVRQQLEMEDDAGQRVAIEGGGREHRGWRLLDRVIACMSPVADRRRSACVQLEAEVDRPVQPGWMEGWIRYALGMARLGEEEVAARQRGVVHLVHLPARFGASQPYLAGLALARVVDAVAEAGDDEAAAVLASELERRFPGHPVHAVAPPAVHPVHEES